MKRGLLSGSLLLLITGCGGEQAASPLDDTGVALPREQAVQTVINEVLIPAGLGASDVVVYAPVEPLQAGDRVLPVLAVDGSQAVPFVIEQATWFFWIDLVPFAGFAHATQFVHVDASTGEVRVENQLWYAVINEEEFLPVEDENDPRRVFGDPVYPETVATAPVAKKSTVEDRNFPFGIDRGAEQPNALANVAIVVNPWPSSTNTKKDFDNMVKVFTDHGYSVVTVSPSPAGADATRDSILAALDNLAGDRAEPLGQVVFYYTGHGTPGALVMGNEMNSDIVISGLDLAKKIQPIDALEFVIILDACYTGSFVSEVGNALRGLLTDNLKVTDRTVAVYSAADPNQLSWTDFSGGGAYTNSLLPKISMIPLGEPIPFVTEGNLFQVDPFGIRQIVPFIGNDTRQTPQWDYICPCSPRGITAPVHLNARFKDGNVNCGQPKEFVSRLVFNWSHDGTITIRETVVRPEIPGIFRPDGSFLVSGQTPNKLPVSYDGNIFCDCGGTAVYTLTDAVGCVTAWDVFWDRAPWE